MTKKCSDSNRTEIKVLEPSVSVKKRQIETSDVMKEGTLQKFLEAH